MPDGVQRRLLALQQLGHQGLEAAAAAKVLVDGGDQGLAVFQQQPVLQRAGPGPALLQAGVARLLEGGALRGKAVAQGVRDVLGQGGVASLRGFRCGMCGGCPQCARGDAVARPAGPGGACGATKRRSAPGAGHRRFRTGAGRCRAAARGHRGVQGAAAGKGLHGGRDGVHVALFLGHHGGLDFARAAQADVECPAASIQSAAPRPGRARQIWRRSRRCRQSCLSAPPARR